jgi:hypothetical protein
MWHRSFNYGEFYPFCLKSVFDKQDKSKFFATNTFEMCPPPVQTRKKNGNFYDRDGWFKFLGGRFQTDLKHRDKLVILCCHDGAQGGFTPAQEVLMIQL